MLVVRSRFRRYVESCMAGRRHLSENDFVTSEKFPPGATIRASNCCYRLEEDGSFTKLNEKPAGGSQLYRAVRPRTNDKYGNMRFAGIPLSSNKQ